jgi:DNA-binding NarL/FixJ family response regulator
VRPLPLDPALFGDWRRTCYRCGAEFYAEHRRLCDGCRAPERPKKRIHKPGEPLTRREWEVVALVMEGKLNKQIANTLALTEGTVKVYVHRIFQKAQVNTRTSLAMKAVAGGLS